MTGTGCWKKLARRGGDLEDGGGARFMHAYDPRDERATRDIVSRAYFSPRCVRPHAPNGGVWLEHGAPGSDNVRR